MSKHPSFYFEIGQKARDLLYKDHIQHSSTDGHSQYFDHSFDLSCEDLAPGLKTAFRFVVPETRRVEIKYLHDYGGITAGIGLSLQPTLSFSSLLGGSIISVGTEVAFSTASKMFTRCNVGLNFTHAFLTASFKLNEMGNGLKASCYSTLNPLTNTAVAAELAHSFSDNKSYLTIGIQHFLFQVTLVKARASTCGRIGAIIQHELLPTFFLTMAGELETKATERGAKLGLSLALRP